MDDFIEGGEREGFIPNLNSIIMEMRACGRKLGYQVYIITYGNVFFFFLFYGSWGGEPALPSINSGLAYAQFCLYRFMNAIQILGVKMLSMFAQILLTLNPAKISQTSTRKRLSYNYFHMNHCSRLGV